LIVQPEDGLDLFDPKGAYKLNLTVDFSAEPPEKEQSCLMCLEKITSAYVMLITESPIFQIMYFEQTCFTQVILVTLNLWKDLSKTIENDTESLDPLLSTN